MTDNTLQAKEDNFQKALKELTDYCDANDVEVSVNLSGRRETYTPVKEGRPSVEDRWDYDSSNMPEDWDYEYSGWANSSTHC